MTTTTTTLLHPSEIDISPMDFKSHQLNASTAPDVSQPQFRHTCITLKGGTAGTRTLQGDFCNKPAIRSTVLQLAGGSITRDYFFLLREEDCSEFQPLDVWAEDAAARVPSSIEVFQYSLNDNSQRGWSGSWWPWKSQTKKNIVTRENMDNAFTWLGACFAVWAFITVVLGDEDWKRIHTTFKMANAVWKLVSSALFPSHHRRKEPKGIETDGSSGSSKPAEPVEKTGKESDSAPTSPMVFPPSPPPTPPPSLPLAPPADLPATKETKPRPPPSPPSLPTSSPANEQDLINLVTSFPSSELQKSLSAACQKWRDDNDIQKLREKAARLQKALEISVARERFLCENFQRANIQLRNAKSKISELHSAFELADHRVQVKSAKIKRLKRLLEERGLDQFPQPEKLHEKEKTPKWKPKDLVEDLPEPPAIYDERPKPQKHTSAKKPAEKLDHVRANACPYPVDSERTVDEIEFPYRDHQGTLVDDVKFSGLPEGYAFSEEFLGDLSMAGSLRWQV